MGEVEFEEELYGASADRLLARLREVSEGTASVMLIGHNPGIEELAGSLASGGAHLAEMRAKYPTGALATLVLDGSWSDLGPGSAELRSFVKPRDL
jgi:phosphohistidine phosphatase